MYNCGTFSDSCPPSPRLGWVGERKIDPDQWGGETNQPSRFVQHIGNTFYKIWMSILHKIGNTFIIVAKYILHKRILANEVERPTNHRDISPANSAYWKSWNHANPGNIFFCVIVNCCPLLQKYRVIFLTGPPDFQYQNEKTCSANEELFYIENFVKN